MTFDMNDGSAWTLVQDPDSAAEFGFDYSPFGIPPAPNSDDTRGLRLTVNNADPGNVSAIAAAPMGLNLSGSFRVEADVWMNFYADIDEFGTTEFGGVFVGFDPANGPINGAGLMGSGDGGAAVDFRLFAGTTVPDSEAYLPLDSGQYFDLEFLDNSDPIFAEAFPPAEVPAEQVDEFDPGNEPVLTPPGALGFAWHKLSVDVDTVAGIALFAIDDLEIAFADAELNDLDLSGGIALTAWDIFTSVAPVPAFSFTVYDNLTVTMENASIPGDFNRDGILDAFDIDLLSAEIRDGGQNLAFDVDGNGDVDIADHQYWVAELKGTYLGDANLDGTFDSADFVLAFQRGQYEDQEILNSGWEDGDWNTDGDFDSSDFVAAFQEGGRNRPTAGGRVRPRTRGGHPAGDRTAGAFQGPAPIPLVANRRSKLDAHERTVDL